MPDDEVEARGLWYDVPVLHEGRTSPRTKRFERNVGSEGYDRQSGVDVPKDPVYRRPGESAPTADPFAAVGKKGGHAGRHG